MDINDYMIPCINKSIFGVECLGCGAQRALVLILKGEYKEAFYMFPPIYTTLIFFIVASLHFIDKSRNYHKTMIILAVLNAVIMVVSYIYKQTNL